MEQPGPALAPVKGQAIREVSRRQGRGKAHGADGWGPAELRALPETWPGKLGVLTGCWEGEVKWPATLCNVVFAVIPKAKADTEAQLRPIGLLPTVQRLDWFPQATTHRVASPIA